MLMILDPLGQRSYRTINYEQNPPNPTKCDRMVNLIASHQKHIESDQSHAVNC